MFECKGQRTLIGMIKPVKRLILFSGLAAQHSGSASRHQSQRHEQTGQQGICDGEPHIRKDLARHSLYEYDGHKDDHCCQGRRENSTRYLFGALNGSFARRNAQAAQAIDIFNDDNGIVHQHAYAQGKAAHRNDVQRNAGKIHQHKSSYNTDHDAGAYDDGGLPIF